MPETAKRLVVVSMFTPALMAAWAVVFALTVAIELVPMPRVHPYLFYNYCASKGILFCALGALTPLAFWRFKSLGVGFLFSALASAGVEGLQWLVHGHRTSMLELGLKLLILFVSFAFALNLRHDQQLRIGSWMITLRSVHPAV